MPHFSPPHLLFSQGRPFRSVSALSFVPPSPIFHPCTLSPLILAGAGHLGPSLPSFRPIFPLPTPYSGRGRPFRSVSALSFVPPSPIFRSCTLSPLNLAGAGHLGPSLPSFRSIFPILTLYSGRGRPFRSVSALSFVLPSPIFRPCTLSPLNLAGAGHLGPSLPSFRPIFPLPTPYSGRGRPFRSVSALSFVPPSPISHPCTLSPLILAGAGHLGPSLPSFRPIFPLPTPYSGRGRPFRSVSALSFVPPPPIFHPCTLSPLILAGAGHLGPSLPSSPHFSPYSGRGRPFRSVSALSFVPPSPIFRPCTLSPLILAGAGHLGPSLPSFRPIFPLPTPYSGRGRPFRSVSAFFSPHFSSPTPYSGRGRPFRSVSALSFVPPSPISHPCTLSPLNLAGAGYLGPSLPSFRPIFPLPTPYSGRGRPFRSVSALSFVPPSPIFHPCTLSPLILAGAGHLGPSLPSFRPIFPLPTPYSGRGRPSSPSLPFRSSHLLPFSAPAPCHPLFWQGPAI